ncbi:TMEM175 family protein [Phenylobacterium aquaticum]|uniref:TMEM175 family protein n=1 Tax=Phenylobacterium aquaticum TaxID=1763816 RepID=UPI001F5CCAA7|nr:TMEM175 family protein [Phenylobacterium aquaticum]MCI3134373.1 TMEM175 family protein [Phenylobacterium aquaticum]
MNAADRALLDRMLFFSDAVFAIVLTLLVLELRPPERGAPLMAGLAAMSGHFVAFFMSFALVGVFWAAHMNTLRILKHFDWSTAWANLVFLAPVSLMPFASSLVGERGFGRNEWSAYCLVMILTSACMMALVTVILRGGGRLCGGISGREHAYRLVRAAAPGLAFGVGLTATSLGQLDLGQLCWLLIPVIFLAARPLRKPTAADAET